MKYIIIFLATLIFSTSTFAKKGNPVSHKHGNRTHSHSLPKTGINHSHNKSSSSPTRSSWVYIGKTSTDLVEAKPGSFEISSTRGGKPIAVIVGQMINNKTKGVSIYQWYVPLKDCNNKMGKLVALDMNGTFKFDNDFVFGGRSIGSEIAERICGVYKSNQREKYKKGK